MPSSQMLRFGVGTAMAGVFIFAGLAYTAGAHNPLTVPRVQVIGLSMSWTGTTGVRAIAQPSIRAVSSEIPKDRWWVGLVGASTWSPPPATFIEAGISRGLHGDMDVHPYAASQVLSQTYEIVLYRQLAIAAQVPHTYVVEKIGQGANARWHASVCNIDQTCTVLLRTSIPANNLPFALIGGESNGIGWDVLKAQQAQWRTGDSSQWQGWCFDPAWAHVAPDGAGILSPCTNYAWSVMRPLDAPLVELSK